jgi:hypothetical protein
MAPPEQQPEDNRKLVTVLAPWAESFSKGVAVVAIAVYACGFLIISLHHWKYGFIGTNPFRPRILAAGAWFFFFSAIPITIATRYRALSWMKLTQNLLTFYVVSATLSFTLSYLFFDLSAYPPASAPLKWLWVWAIGLLLAAGILMFISSSRRFPPIVSGVVSALLVLLLTQSAIRDLFISHKFQQPALVLWFFGVIVATIVELKVRSKRNLVEAGEWSKPLVGILAILLMFARYYYPHLKASWGGGTPVSVTIYFTKDSAISPNKAVSAQLIEESDEGFYLVGPKETRAIFVPRSAVALVYFSDTVADSPLLRDSK